MMEQSLFLGRIENPIQLQSCLGKKQSIRASGIARVSIQHIAVAAEAGQAPRVATNYTTNITQPRSTRPCESSGRAGGQTRRRAAPRAAAGVARGVSASRPRLIPSVGMPSKSLVDPILRVLCGRYSHSQFQLPCKVQFPSYRGFPDLFPGQITNACKCRLIPSAMAQALPYRLGSSMTPINLGRG